MFFVQNVSRFPVHLSGMMLVFLVIAACTGCAGSDQPVSPQTAAVQTSLYSEPITNHQFWGYWEGYIPETHDSIELVPVRGAGIHLNTRRMMEDTVCTDCIAVTNVEVDPSGQILRADIQLTHPYPGVDKFTGFDVRAVVISDGSMYFPGLDAMVPHVSTGDFTLINPDGYTRLWNTIEFPPGSGPLPILEYSEGKFATPGDFTGTVNPYIKYSMDPRDHFPAGGSIIKTMEFNLVPGSIKFGYAIDASWASPLADPVTNIWTDFPPSANALEPGVLSYIQTDKLTSQVGDTGHLNVQLVDRQGIFGHAIAPKELEAPDLWDGAILAKGLSDIQEEYLWNTFSISFAMTNEKGAESGEYFALLKAQDFEQDFWLGDINHAYELLTITVEEPPGFVIEGTIAFLAPGPPGPGGSPGAINMFVKDLGTMEETQITPFVGLGIFVGEPRINPTGTHVLLDTATTPWHSWVTVYELGGGSWGVSPSDVYDADGDFHPDGEHIVVASGAGFAETQDLYTMKYDGSERTLLVTAPDPALGPKWCPDGNRIAMTVIDPTNGFESALWVYNVSEDTWTELQACPGQDNNPSWSPVPIDGHYLIAYETTRQNPNGWERDIWVVDADTDAEVAVLDLDGVYVNHPTFSPDGMSFMFHSDDGNDTELYVYHYVLDEFVQITNDDTSDGSASWCWGW